VSQSDANVSQELVDYVSQKWEDWVSSGVEGVEPLIPLSQEILYEESVEEVSDYDFVDVCPSGFVVQSGFGNETSVDNGSGEMSENEEQALDIVDRPDEGNY
jgi:hypothetical protein